MDRAAGDNKRINQFLEVTGCGSQAIAAAAIADADGDVAEAIVRHLSAEAATSNARHSSSAGPGEPTGGAASPGTQAPQRRPRSPPAPSMLHAPARPQPAASSSGGGAGVPLSDIGVFCDFTGNASAAVARDFLLRSGGDVGAAIEAFLAAPPPPPPPPPEAMPVVDLGSSDASVIDLSGPSASAADLGAGSSHHDAAPSAASRPPLYPAARAPAPARSVAGHAVMVASPPRAAAQRQLPSPPNPQQPQPQQAAAPDDDEEEEQMLMPPAPQQAPAGGGTRYVLPPFQQHPPAASVRSLAEALASTDLEPKPKPWPLGLPFVPRGHEEGDHFIMWVPIDHAHVRRLAEAFGKRAEEGVAVRPQSGLLTAVLVSALRQLSDELPDDHSLQRLGLRPRSRFGNNQCFRFTSVDGAPCGVVEIGIRRASADGICLPACQILGESAQSLFPSLTPRELPDRHLAPVQVQGLALRLHQHQRESVGLMAFREQQGLNTVAVLTLLDGRRVAVGADGAGLCESQAVVDRHLAQAMHMRGGVLADEMGLGKTISIIALAALNPMTQVHAHAARERFGQTRIPIKTTLVLGTVSIVGQWEQEIKRAMPTAVCRRFYGTGREWADNVWHNLDFAVSTFQTAKNSANFLNRFIFHRIVVDEYPQAPCTGWIGGMSQRLWFVSGTPTRSHHLNVLDGARWNAAGVSRRVNYIELSTIRHTKTQVTNDALNLPPRTSRIAVFDLDPAERVLYDAAERPVVTALRSFGHVAALDNAFGQVRNWLCSLRLAATDVRGNNGEIQQAPTANFNVDQANLRAEYMLTPTSTLLDVFEKNGFAITGSLRELIEKLRRVPPEFEDCCVCMDVMREPCVLRCTHAFCKECVQALASSNANAGPSGNSARVVCPECRADTVTRVQKYHLVRDAPDVLAPSAPAAGSSATAAAVMTPAQARARLPSKPSRVTYAVKLIRDTLAADPTAKFVVFSSFQNLLDSVEGALTSGPSPLSTIKIVGSVPLVQRARHVASFQDRGSSTKVCLLSSKASAAGLTLTAANHVILLEPATNSSVEAQAAARIHRIGQTRPVTVHRLAARGTVEERLLALAAAGDVPDTGMGCFGDSGAGLDAARKALDGRAA